VGAPFSKLPIDLTGLGSIPRRRRAGLAADVTSSFVASYQASLQARIQSLGAQSAATLQAETGVDVTQTRVAQGASAALTLAQNGYNPSSGSDNQALVSAIAGGLCLIPAVGPALGAAVEVLYQVGNAAACPIAGVAASLGLGPVPPGCPGYVACTHTGTWTAAGILAANAPQLPSYLRDGTFQKFVVGALAQYASQAANCMASLPPGVLVDAAVNIWNQTHAGPAAQVLVPPLSQTNKGIMAYGTPTIITAWQHPNTSGNGLAALAGKDPYAYYAFDLVGNIAWTDEPNTASLPSGAGPWTPWTIAPTPPLITSLSSGLSSDYTDPPRVVMVHTGPPIATATTTTLTFPGQVSSFETGKTYIIFQRVPGAATDGTPAVAGTPVMTEQDFMEWSALFGFAPVQMLWWGPSSTSDDPSGVLTTGTSSYRDIFALAGALHGTGGLSVTLATYNGQTAAVDTTNVTAFDVTGALTPRQTVLWWNNPLIMTGVVGGGAIALAAAVGTLYALATGQGVGAFWSSLWHAATSKAAGVLNEAGSIVRSVTKG
jgi:hypothetical protein